MNKLALGAALLLSLVACGSRSRPPVSAWQRVWIQAKTLVPGRLAFEHSSDREQCSRLLVAARDMETRLLPSPDAMLDAAVERWVAHAAQIGFECPIDRGEPRLMDHELAQLTLLAAEIDGALAALYRRDA